MLKTYFYFTLEYSHDTDRKKACENVFKKEAKNEKKHWFDARRFSCVYWIQYNP